MPDNRSHFGWVQLLIAFILPLLVFLSLSRLVLMTWQVERITHTGDLAYIMFQGVRFDLVLLSILIILPAMVIPILMTNKYAFKPTLSIFKAYCLFLTGTLVFMELVTPSFIAQFGFRPNILFVEYMNHPKEIVAMLLKVSSIQIIATIIVTSFSVFGMYKLMTLAFNHTKLGIMLTAPLMSFLALAFCILAARSTLDNRPVNPSTVAFSSDPLINSLPLNSTYTTLYAIYEQFRNEKNDKEYEQIKTVSEVRCIPKIEQAIRPDFSKDSLNMIIMGDTGQEGERRQSSIKSIEKIVQQGSFSEAILLGDNFYPSGVTSTSDKKWETGFEQLFKPTIFTMPFYTILGNHDYRGNTRAEVDYSKINSRWNMPNKYYSMRKQFGFNNEASALMLMIDTNTLEKDINMESEQFKWIITQLKQSKDRYVLIFGHHPIFSNGGHGDNEILKSIFDAINKVHTIDLYMNGHEHDLQILKDVHETTFITNGAFSKAGNTTCKSNTIYASNQAIAVALKLTKEKITAFTINKDGAYDFSYSL